MDYSKRIIIVRWADLSDFFFVHVRRKNMYFCFTSNENCHFLRKNDYTQNGLLIFLGKETHSETKSWKSSRILSVNPFFHFSFFFSFFLIFHFLFFFIFFHFFICFSFFSFFFIFSFVFHFFLFSHLFIYFIFSFFSFFFSFISFPHLSQPI